MKAVNRQHKPAGLWEKTRTQNLVRNTASGIYYARFRTNGKLTWRSLDTDVYTNATLRLPDVMKAERKLVAAGDGQITFEQAEQIYRKRIEVDLDFKPKTKEYHVQRLEALVASWPEIKERKLRSVTEDECRNWASQFAANYSPSSFNHTLGILRAIFEIGIRGGARYDNPAKGIKRLKERSKKLSLPEPDQFKDFVAEVEAGGGRDSRNCANLVRFLAFGGMRITESKNVTWADCDFKRGQITVRGDPVTGTKGEGQARLVPMIPEMKTLLERLRSQRPDEPSSAGVMLVHECQKAIDRAAKKIGMTRITHHDFRHMFATRCIESGVDIPTVSRWLGHKDGGALAMRVYGHLRDEHSAAMAQRVTFSVAGQGIG